jgi:hypothetical protein
MRLCDICLCAWLISLTVPSMMPQGIRFPSLMVYMFHGVCILHFLIHSSADGHIGLSCVLATVNSATINVGVR